MGIKMALDSSVAQAKSVQTMVSQQRNAYATLSQALEGILNSESELKGKTYDSLRNFIRSVILPLKSACATLILAAQEAVQSLPDEYMAQVGAESLDEDELLQDIARWDRLIREMQDQIASMSGTLSEGGFKRLDHYNSLLNSYYANKSVLQEKLDKLRAFNARSATLFATVEQLNSAIQTGVSQCATAWDASTGTFTIPSDLSWVTTTNQIKNTLYSLAAIGKTEIINDYITSYGLDKETATALFHLQQGILKKARKEDWSNAKVVYEFNRLVASFAPDNFVSLRWKAVCGTVDIPERDQLCREYGLNSVDIENLRQNIPKQHNEGTYKDLAHEAVQLAAFSEQSWELDPKTLAHMLSEFLNHSKYSSLSGNLENYGIRSPSVPPLPMSLEHYEISFKGDVDSGRYSDTDFNSDLDPINTYHLMKDKSRDDLFKVVADYHFQVNSNQLNRVETFYANMGFGDVEQGKRAVRAVLADVPSLGKDFITRGQSLEEQQKHQAVFYDYLERGREQNVR